MINISVIVCCYNSQHLIKDTLKHIAVQQTNKTFNYEVILVDNNCKDQTVEVANNVWIGLGATIDLNIVKEARPGLSYARETGVNHSKGDLIIFCDDDNWLASDYLLIAFNFMTKHTQVGVLGGQSIGVLESNAPDWWDKKAENYAVGKQAIKSGDITGRGYVWGAGMVFRKSLFLKLYNTGFESLLSDRKGDLLSSGGDSEICKWFILMGYKLWYLEALTYKHYITADRLNYKYLVKLIKGHSQARTTLSLYDRFASFVNQYNGYRLENKDYVVLLLKTINRIIRGKKTWKESLQLSLRNSLKVHKELFTIIKTYRKLKQII